MIINIARKELNSMFASPMGWVILAIMQFSVGTYYTLSFNQYFEILSMRGVLPEQMGMTQFMCEGIFGSASILLIFIIPLVSMRLISDEIRSQTMTFLTSAPISITEIILGKFLALIVYHSLLIVMMVFMILILSIWAEVDYGLLITNVIGLWLLMCFASAVGLFFSSQTQYAVIAGFFTFLTLSLLVMIEKFFSTHSQPLLSQLSIMSHYRNFSNGMLNTHDIIFFILFSMIFVLMSINRLHVNRITGN